MKVLKGCGKIVLAGLVAIAILSLLLCGYSLIPVHIENQAGNTDYVWPAHAPWVRMTEGISWGRYDANGYNNLAVIDDPDIIILGSSHMEACNVMQDETVGTLLNERLEDYAVYNMGISGHSLDSVCRYLPANLELYDVPPKAVIIETADVSVTEESVDSILNNTVARTPSHSTGLVGTLQKLPFLRLMYHQMVGGLMDLFLAEQTSAAEPAGEVQEMAPVADAYAYGKLFAYLASLEERYGTQIIIFYHPPETLEEDGTISFPKDVCLSAFSAAAEEHEITFVDMTEPFEQMFYEAHHVPHGFVTGEIGTGHLNAYGHAAVADALADAIAKLEEDGELCK